MIITYFIDNIVTQMLISGGYYTLGTIVILLILAWWNKSFRIIFFSVLVAIFGVSMLIFLFESLGNINFLPSTY